MTPTQKAFAARNEVLHLLGAARHLLLTDKDLHRIVDGDLDFLDPVFASLGVFDGVLTRLLLELGMKRLERKLDE